MSLFLFSLLLFCLIGRIESGLTCSYNGKELKNGEKWSIDKCKTCECKDGLNRCRDKTCKNLSCTWMVIPEGECCPVCRGCVSDSGDLYNDSAVWKENDCTTCTCKDGHAQCQSEMCAVTCTNPKHVPGQCCPVCPEETVAVIIPTLCPSVNFCDLSCVHGLEQSAEGCFLCQCKSEPCELDCPYGFKSDVEGYPICQCRSPDVRCPPWDETKCDKKCQYGFQTSSDGCIKCRCNKCPVLFDCTKRCLNGYVLNDEGCELCKCKDIPEQDMLSSNTTPESTSDGRSCMTTYGSRRMNGESWNDGCRVCNCHNGVEMCSLIACQAPHCPNPVFRLGDCCPSCPGLTISPPGEKELCKSALGHFYVEGETWQMDPCTKCVCHAGAILCETETCPPVLCHHPVRQEGKCCASCRGDDLTTTSLAGAHGPRHCRTSEGMMYKQGETWRSTPCQSCVCESGQIHCYNQMCPPVNCARTVLKKGQCCPQCVEASRPKICSYNGETFDSGERWQGDNCTQCLCVQGKTECFPLTCKPLHCTVLIRKRGQCCPECYDLSKIRKKENKERDNKTDTRELGTERDANIVGFAVLGVIVFVLAVAVAVLAFLLMRRRQGGARSQGSPRLRHPRPKSTNLELQGNMPFIPNSQNKPVNMEKPYLEKLCPPGLVSTTGVNKGDRTTNDYTEMVFPDQITKETMANGHFLKV